MYRSILTNPQKELLKSVFKPLRRQLRKHDPFDILEAIAFVAVTGCQWRKLLVSMKRLTDGQNGEPTVGIIDSQSVRIGLPDSESGVDGGKRVKGIKRHLVVDKNGWPLGVYVTTANVHDTKGAVKLLSHIFSNYQKIKLIKGDRGYRGYKTTGA